MKKMAKIQNLLCIKKGDQIAIYKGDTNEKKYKKSFRDYRCNCRNNFIRFNGLLMFMWTNFIEEIMFVKN